MNDIRLALVGLGLVGKRHAEAIFRLKNVRLVSIVDLSEEAKIYASERNIPFFEDLNEMLASTSVDGVILATPTPLHVEQGLICIEHKIPLLVEKPIATTVEEATQLVESAKRANINILVGHHRRHNPIVQKAWELIQTNRLGKIRAVNMTCWFYKPDEYFDIAPWRKHKGAGPISVNLIHDIDLIRFFCGEVQEVQAQATPATRGFENEDVAGAILRFENGIIGTISISDTIVSPWSWELTSHEYPIYPPTIESCYYIGGTLGSLSMPDLRVWHHEGDANWWKPISATSLIREKSDPLVNQIEHFAEVIAKKTEPIVSGEEGLRTLEVIEAIQKATKSNQTISLKEMSLS